jgi:hypothetical protein
MVFKAGKARKRQVANVANKRKKGDGEEEKTHLVF